MNRILFSLSLSMLAGMVYGQHQHHEGMDMSKHEGMNMDSTRGDMKTLNHGLTMDASMPGMTHSLSRNLPMNRNGSGTSWHPDNTPMYAYMSKPSPKGWSYMLHLRHLPALYRPKQQQRRSTRQRSAVRRTKLVHGHGPA
ncbi:hypothetical protein [Spirosoma sp.]|uniref:hypothetical protein n=1 Tax=Spirosoma sp. TaxID=1899569 RepID=UPI003431AEF7